VPRIQDKSVDESVTMKGLIERGNNLYIRKVYRDSTGKKKQIWRKVESRSEGKTLFREIENELARGTESFENRDTLNSYLDKWLLMTKGTVSDRTHGDYENLLRLYFRPALGNKRLASVKPMDIQSVITDMSARGLSPKTIQYAHMVLQKALKEAVMPFQLLTTNPARELKLPKQIKKERKALSPEAAQTFLRECESSKHGLLFEFALITGMRPEEYLALQWGDLDLNRATATIQRVLVRNRKGGGWTFQPPKTPRSRRTIPFPAYLAIQLESHKRVQNEARLRLGPDWQHNDLVFSSECGSPLSLRNLQRRHFKPLLDKAGLEDMRTYDLRHSCATLLLAADENPKVVSERLGHASIVLTLDTYSHCLPTMQQGATKKLEKLLNRN
jgi:integrase